MKFIPFCATFLALLLATALGEEAKTITPKKIWADSYIGRKAPDLKIEKWITEKPSTEGKFVMIDFWSIGCGPCRKAIPELNKFQEKFRDKLVVIGISDQQEDAVRTVTEKEIRYASAIDTNAETKKALKITGIPHIILINPQGIVVWEGFPFLEGYELTEKSIQEIIGK